MVVKYLTKGILMKKKLMLLTLALSTSAFLPSCTNEKETTSAESSVNDISSEIESNSSERESSSVIEVEYTFKLLAEVNELKVGDSLKLTYETNFENAKVSFKSDNEEILSVSEEGLVKALKKGEAAISASLEGTKLKDSVSFHVVTPDEYYLSRTAKNLETSLTKEKENAVGGNFDASTFKVYKNSLQINYSETNKEKFYLEGKTLRNLLLTEKAITDTSVGVLDEDLTQEAIDNNLKLAHYVWNNNVVYGFSNLVKEILNGKYFYGYDKAKEGMQATITKKNDVTEYSFASKYLDDSTSYDKKYYENSLIFSFDNNDQLLDGQYAIKEYGASDYDMENKKLVDSAKPRKTLASSFSLAYGTRTDEDAEALDKSDYLIQSFEIDTSSFRNHGEGEALLYVGDQEPLQIKNVIPTIYLEDTFNVKNISDPSVLTTFKNGNVTYLSALKKGETTLEVETSMLKTASIKIKVIDVPVTKIEFGANVQKEIDVGQKAEYKVDVSPVNAGDRSWTAKFENKEMEKIASLSIDQENSKFILEGLSGGKVKVLVSSLSNPEINASIEVTVKAKAEESAIDTLKALMIGSTYKNSLGSFIIKDGTNGEATLYGNNKYNFTFSILEQKGTFVFSIDSVTPTSSINQSKYQLQTGTGKSSLEPNTISEDGKTLVVTNIKTSSGLTKLTCKKQTH